MFINVTRTDQCNKRVEVIPDTWRTREPFFNIHRTLLHVAADCNAGVADHVKDALGITWLRSAKLARLIFSLSLSLSLSPLPSLPLSLCPSVLSLS